MAGKLKFLVGLGAGYVLGTRQGREQYEKIVEKAQGLWRNPKVQDAAEKVQTVAEEKVGDVTGSGSSSSGSSAASAGGSDFGSGSGSSGSGFGSGDSSTGGSSTGGPA